jgi:Tfp pilus assembly protein PilV
MERSMNSGASLVEICIAILIIGLSAILIMTFSRNSFTMLGDARGSETAQVLAQEKFTELTAEAFPVSGSDIVVANNTDYIRSWTVKDTGFIKRAIITVKYKTGSSEKTVNFMGALN